MKLTIKIEFKKKFHFSLHNKIYFFKSYKNAFNLRIENIHIYVYIKYKYNICY